jgi:hypothetical protein
MMPQELAIPETLFPQEILEILHLFRTIKRPAPPPGLNELGQENHENHQKEAEEDQLVPHFVERTLRIRPWDQENKIIGKRKNEPWKKDGHAELKIGNDERLPFDVFPESETVCGMREIPDSHQVGNEDYHGHDPLQHGEGLESRDQLEPMFQVKDEGVQRKKKNSQDGSAEYQAVILPCRVPFIVLVPHETISKAIKGKAAVPGEDQPRGEEHEQGVRQRLFGFYPAIAHIENDKDDNEVDDVVEHKILAGFSGMTFCRCLILSLRTPFNKLSPATTHPMRRSSRPQPGSRFFFLLFHEIQFPSPWRE